MHTSHRGGAVLALLVALFLLSFAAATAVAVLLWRDTNGAPSILLQRQPTPDNQLPEESTLPRISAAPTALPDSVLVPEFIVDSALQDDTEELTRQLLIPLRAYYATKQERLGSINVRISEDIEHTAQVEYELIDEEGAQTHTFFYDRTGEDKTGPYPAWEPSLLDVT